MTKEITHRYDRELDRMVQLVSPKRLREILDRDGDDYSRPEDFSADDEWEVEGGVNSFVRINETGRANLIEWLAHFLAEGRDPERNADHLISQFDGSDPNCTPMVEIGRSLSRSGNPLTYEFGRDEYDLIEEAE